ncbi:MAG: nucleotidyltransferase domain-containing protein [Candidatus Hydrothermarchaeaceae archaeon]
MNDMSWGLFDCYLHLHTTCDGRPFTIKEASGVLAKPPGATRVDVHRLSKNLALNRIGRGRYTTVDPDKWAGIMAALKKLPGLKPFFEKILPMLHHIDSILLYGSHIRGDSTKESDYDILIVTDGTRLFTEEEGKELKMKGFEVTDGHITELRKNIKSNPVYLVPLLKESWPIFNKKVKKSLLKSFRKENILNDLRDISEDLINLKYIGDPDDDRKRSMLYLYFSRLRHLFLIDSVLHEKKFFKKELLNRMRESWNLSDNEIAALHKLYRDIEHKKEPDVGYFNKCRMDKMSEGSMNYFNNVFHEMEAL